MAHAHGRVAVDVVRQPSGKQLPRFLAQIAEAHADGLLWGLSQSLPPGAYTNQFALGPGPTGLLGQPPGHGGGAGGPGPAPAAGQAQGHEPGGQLGGGKAVADALADGVVQGLVFAQGVDLLASVVPGHPAGGHSGRRAQPRGGTVRTVSGTSSWVICSTAGSSEENCT